MPVMGKSYKVGKNTLNVLGYISQSAQYSAKSNAGDEYDVESGFNQALMTAFLETELNVSNNLKFYVAGKIAVDWMYDLKNNDDSWSRKNFSSSRDDLYLDDEWWQILQEAHVTWAPGSFLFRLGKQIVSWGEMDFMRVMDQINPTDQRRGFSDVEFETSVIPLPMFRGEWWPDMSTLGSFFDELGIQFVLVPNADFIPDLGPSPANDASGIWAANVIDGATGARIGGLNSLLREPDEWAPDEFEFGLRLQGLSGATVITFNAFYGRANTPVQMVNLDPSVADPILGPPLAPGSLGSMLEAFGIIPPGSGLRDTDGRDFLFLNTAGYYPIQKFVGLTIATEIPALGLSALGGAAPVIRAEAKYQLDRVFEEGGMNPYFNPATGALINGGFIESDMLELGVGLDWKFKINFINSRAYIDTSTQFFYNRIMDYPSAPFSISGFPEEDTYAVSTAIQTAYFNAKFKPSIAYLYDISNEGQLLILGLNYSPSTTWQYSLDYTFFTGDDTGLSMDVFENKDFLSAKIRYTF
jgi:Protein of unknown function (DUF1302)